jgi:translation initiation factor IF-2
LQANVQLDLSSEGILVEALDGDIPCVPVSGKTGQGIPELLENLSAIAELQDLKAERDGRAHGHILESKIEKGLGYLIFPSALKIVLIFVF